MPDGLVPFADVFEVLKQDILDRTEPLSAIVGKQKHVRLLRHALKFFEYQFGKRIPGTLSYTSNNGDQIGMLK